MVTHLLKVLCEVECARARLRVLLAIVRAASLQLTTVEGRGLVGLVRRVVPVRCATGGMIRGRRAGGEGERRV